MVLHDLVVTVIDLKSLALDHCNIRIILSEEAIQLVYGRFYTRYPPVRACNSARKGNRDLPPPKIAGELSCDLVVGVTSLNVKNKQAIKVL